MGISEEQFDTWSRQGTVPQSSATYATVKAALESPDAHYAARKYNVFLQGSYGNDTNIRSESDVDVVIQLENVFHHNINDLPQDQQALFKGTYSDATYMHSHFKADVLKVLKARFGTDVGEPQKAIPIAARNARRSADVIAAIEYRRYQQFVTEASAFFDRGICFYTAAGTKIVNYPKQHSANLTIKHQATNSMFKPMVRIFKNMRSRAIERGHLKAGTAPSYYLEGLLFNAPNSEFGNTYLGSFIGTVNWLVAADRTRFVCPNGQYPLLQEGSSVSWRAAQCDAFLEAIIKLWNEG